MARCEYRHKAFIDPYAHRGDGTGQCWLEGEHVAPFKIADSLVKHLCVFHAPIDKTSVDPDKDWPIFKRGKAQSKLLRELLDEWNQENEGKEEKKSFVLPGIYCGDIDLQGYVFSHSVRLTGGTFTGAARFDNATFTRDAWFGNATFTGYAWFNNATFTGDAWFNNAKFTRVAVFGNARFNGDVRFDGSKFTGYAGFRGATFTGYAGFNNATFTRYAWFGGATFIEDSGFFKATFGKKLNFTGSDFTLGCDLKDLNIPHLYLSRIKTGYPFNITNCDINELEYTSHVGEKICFNKVKTGLVENAASGAFTFTNQDCSRLSFVNMDLSKSFFFGADISKTRFDSCHWIEPEGKEKYQKVAEHDAIIKEFDKAKNDQTLEQLKLLRSLYRQLMKNLEDNREYATAGDFHYREMQLRQMIAEYESRSGESWMLWAYHGLADYGESYKKLGWGIIFSLIITVGLVFSFETIWNYNRYYFASAVPFVDRLTQIAKAVLFGIVPSGLQRAVDKTLVELTFVSQLLIFIETFFVVIVGSLFVMAVNRRFRR